jgi:hypothetical protein
MEKITMADYYSASAIAFTSKLETFFVGEGDSNSLIVILLLFLLKSITFSAFLLDSSKIMIAPPLALLSKLETFTY